MYPLISKWFVKSGKESKALVKLKKLAEDVEKNEKDTLMYTVHTPKFKEGNLPTPSEGEIIFFEIYASKKAFKKHVEGPIFTKFVKDNGQLFIQSEGKPYVTVEFMNREAGFIRKQLIT
jgi:quinol monooxygenase YgiN